MSSSSYTSIGRRILVLALLVTATGLAEDRAPRLPVEAFFAEPQFSHPKLSPDGEHIAMLYSDGVVQTVAVRQTMGGKIEPIGEMGEAEVRLAWLEWANSNRLLVSLQGRNPDPSFVRSEVRRLLAIDRDGGNLLYLGKHWRREVQHQDQVLHRLPGDPDHVLIQYREPTSESPGVFLMNIHSGSLKTAVQSQPGIHFWLVDHDGVVRAGEGHQGVRYTLIARVDGREEFEKIQDFDIYDEEGFMLAGFSFEPKTIYVSKPVHGRFGIYEYDLSAKKLGKLIFAHPVFDAESLVFDRRRRKLAAVAYTEDEPKRRFLDGAARLEQEAVDRALPRGTFNEIVSESEDGKRAIVLASGDTRPPEYYLLVRDTRPKRLDFLLDRYPDLPEEHLAPVRPVSYPARDGLEIPAYLTLPKGLEPKNLPVVVCPHGGPTARDYRRFDPTVQLFANRGFAVFQMNFRGSSGYGVRHQTLGYREWGLAMQDDITDGVRWLIDKGIADPERIGIYGDSYGGYAALMGLVRTPELYRAAASYAGVTSLPRLISDSKRYLFGDHNRPTIGGGWGDRKRLRASSPVHNADEIQAPVLLAHGEDDPVVHVEHSKKMAAALRKAGKEVELLRFEHEAHGFLLEENRIRFYETLGRFFEKHLDAPISQGR